MSDDYTAAILEDVKHKFDTIIDGQTLLAPMSQKLNDVEERLIRVEGDVKIIKKVVTSHSRELRDHEHRITKLEDDDDREYA
jgi:hypothetical protein